MGNDISDFLVARPSFWEGISRIVDFGNTLQEYNVSSSGDVADAVALRNDWRMVGRALRDAMNEYDVKEEESAE